MNLKQPLPISGNSEMTIYAIRNNREPYYRELDFNQMDIVNAAPESMHPDEILDGAERNRAMAEWWVTPSVAFYAGSDPIPDISVWLTSLLLLSPKAHRVLVDMLKPYGEFLPMVVSGEKYFLFNCLTFGDEDSLGTEFECEGGQELWLKSLAFKTSAESLAMFKSLSNKGMTPFCNQHFKDAVESFALEGLMFDKQLIEVYET